jgi:hypothetical protein
MNAIILRFDEVIADKTNKKQMEDIMQTADE